MMVVFDLKVIMYLIYLSNLIDVMELLSFVVKNPFLIACLRPGLVPLINFEKQVMLFTMCVSLNSDELNATILSICSLFY